MAVFQSPESMTRGELVSAYRRLQDMVGSLQATLERQSRTQGEISRLPGRTSQVVEISRDVNTTDFERIVETAITKAPAVLGAKYAAILLTDHNTQELVFERHTAADDLAFRLHPDREDDTLMAVAIARDRPLAMKTVEEFEHSSHLSLSATPLRAHLTNGCLVLPLMSGDAGDGTRRALGVLVLADREGGAFSEDDLAVAAQVGELMGAALATCWWLQEMRHLAELDGLTRLLNQNLFRENLDVEITRYRRYGTDFSVIMLDIDRLQELNDQYGHDAGDRVLKETARVVTGNLRTGIDVAARYDAGLFAIITPETELAGAATAAQRIRQAIEEFQAEHQGVKLSFTVSCGAAQYAQEENPITLIDRAQRALAAAKEAGRNQVFVDDNGEVRKEP